MSKSGRTVQTNQHQQHDVGKRNNGKTTGFAAVAKKAGREYGSAAAGKRVAGAVFQRMKRRGQL